MEFFKTKKKVYIKNTDNFVAIFSKNPYEVFRAIKSSLDKGLVVIPLDPALPAKKINQYLAAVNCKNLIADSSLPSDFNYEGRIFDIKSINQCKNPEILLHATRNIFLNTGSQLNKKINILFTSGSAGDPKPVLHTLGNHYYSSLGLGNNIRFVKEDKWLAVLPFHHISGFSIIFRAAFAGAGIAVKEKDEDVCEVLKKENPSHISLVPHQLRDLLSNGKNIDILKKLKAILLGGTRVPANLIEQSHEYGLNLYISYGSTEMCSTITCTKNKDTLKHLKTAGTLLDFRQIKITEKNNILVKGKTLFAGYLTKTKTSDLYIKKAVDRHGYFDTGDLGYIDDEKYLHIMGRKDNIFKYKAEKILPEEIEKIFLNIKGIEDVIVVPYKENEHESVPVIFIKSGREFGGNLKYIKEKIKNELPFYKHPRFYLKWPHTVSRLKLSRAELNKMADEIIKLKLKDRFF